MSDQIKLRTFEAFAGYGSQLLALRRLEKQFPDKLEVEAVGISEIDKYALQAYKALHGAVQNYGDISKIDWTHVPDFDLFTYSFPCTDISVAGKQAGLEEGSNTRSSLLWECQRAITEKRPKFLLLENVAALVLQKFMPYFFRWFKTLEDLGYSSTWQVLNAKDYGVPQNRERVFLVSIRNDVKFPYYFPLPFKLEKRLKDILEDEVDEKYYLTDVQVEGFQKSEYNITRGRLQDGDIHRTLAARDFKDTSVVAVASNNESKI